MFQLHTQKNSKTIWSYAMADIRTRCTDQLTPYPSANQSAEITTLTPLVTMINDFSSI